VRHWETLDKFKRKNLDIAKQGTGYPGPSEARAVTREIEKCRWLVTSHRLTVNLPVSLVQGGPKSAATDSRHQFRQILTDLKKTHWRFLIKFGAKWIFKIPHYRVKQ